LFFHSVRPWARTEITLLDTTRQHRSETRVWQSVGSAPANTDLELRVQHGDVIYVLPFACRRTDDRWLNCEMNVPLAVKPLEWRNWDATERLHQRARSAAWPRSIPQPEASAE